MRNASIKYKHGIASLIREIYVQIWLDCKSLNVCFVLALLALNVRVSGRHAG